MTRSADDDALDEVSQRGRTARPQTTIVPAPFRTFPTRLARENGFPPRPGDGIARPKGGVAGAAQQQHAASTEKMPQLSDDGDVQYVRYTSIPQPRTKPLGPRKPQSAYAANVLLNKLRTFSELILLDGGFDWSEGEDFCPDQTGFEFECTQRREPMTDEEVSLFSAACTWVTYQALDCWAPVLLADHKRCIIKHHASQASGADRLRDWWEQNQEKKMVSFVSKEPNPVEELWQLCSLHSGDSENCDCLRSLCCLMHEPVTAVYDPNYVSPSSSSVNSPPLSPISSCDNEIAEISRTSGFWEASFYQECVASPSSSCDTPVDFDDWAQGERERGCIVYDLRGDGDTASTIGEEGWSDVEDEAPATRTRTKSKQQPNQRKKSGGKTKKVQAPRSSMLDRYQGLDPKCNYRTRILVTHWASLQVPKQVGHESWERSGFVPFNPGMVLDKWVSDEEVPTSVRQGVRGQEERYLQQLAAIISNPQTQAADKFLQMQTVLEQAQLTWSWKQRSIFADKPSAAPSTASTGKRKDDSESSSSNSSDSDDIEFPRFGVIGADIAAAAAKRQVKADAQLLIDKPHACQVCPKR